jgi:hypothetical protein
MRKTAFALTVMLIISIVSGLHFVDVVEANYIPVPSFSVTTPSQHEFSEFEGDVPLNFHLNVRNSSNALELTKISYSVDGAENVSLTNLEQGLRWHVDGQPYLIIYGETVLSGLSEGNHTVVVYAKTPEDAVFSDSVSFGVKTPPSTPTPEPTSTPTPWLVVGSIMVAFVSGFGLLFYLAKKKQSKQT